MSQQQTDSVAYSGNAPSEVDAYTTVSKGTAIPVGPAKNYSVQSFTQDLPTDIRSKLMSVIQPGFDTTSVHDRINLLAQNIATGTKEAQDMVSTHAARTVDEIMSQAQAETLRLQEELAARIKEIDEHVRLHTLELQKRASEEQTKLRSEALLRQQQIEEFARKEVIQIAEQAQLKKEEIARNASRALEQLVLQQSGLNLKSYAIDFQNTVKPVGVMAPPLSDTNIETHTEQHTFSPSKFTSSGGGMAGTAAASQSSQSGSAAMTAGTSSPTSKSFASSGGASIGGSSGLPPNAQLFNHKS